MNSFRPLSQRSSRAGFSLVEMLVVMAIGLILATLSLTALRQVTSSSSLTTAGTVVSDTFAYARQDAIAKNTMTTVVIMTDTAYANAYATFSVWEYSTTTQAWSQITPWKTLPPGIVFDNGTGNGNAATVTINGSSVTVNSTYITTAATIAPMPGSTSSSVISTAASATITYLGNTLTAGTIGSAGSQQFAWQTFMPTGRLYNANTAPYTLILVEGTYNNTGTITYTHPSGGNPANYVWYYFNSFDGLAKIVRP